MPIDPRIATSLQPTDIAGAIAGGMQFHDQRQKQSRLADLLPQAMGHPGVISENGGTQEDAIAQLYSVDPQLAMRLDEHQRELASHLADDLGSAVRWADTPEKWQYVQQHYGEKGIDLSPYRFEDRERGLVALGQMSGYLKDPPKAEYRTLEPGGSLIDVSGGQPRVVIAPNDGSYQTGAPAGGNIPSVTDQQSYDAVPTGSQYRTPDGHIRVKQGGPSQSGSGGFPY
jgi:hypothetical protein